MPRFLTFVFSQITCTYETWECLLQLGSECFSNHKSEIGYRIVEFDCDNCLIES
jgi:hypothetical protein